MEQNEGLGQSRLGKRETEGDGDETRRGSGSPELTASVFIDAAVS